MVSCPTLTRIKSRHQRSRRRRSSVLLSSARSRLQALKILTVTNRDHDAKVKLADLRHAKSKNAYAMY